MENQVLYQLEDLGFPETEVSGFELALEEKYNAFAAPAVRKVLAIQLAELGFGHTSVCREASGDAMAVPTADSVAEDVLLVLKTRDAPLLTYVALLAKCTSPKELTFPLFKQVLVNNPELVAHVFAFIQTEVEAGRMLAVLRPTALYPSGSSSIVSVASAEAAAEADKAALAMAAQSLANQRGAKRSTVTTTPENPGDELVVETKTEAGAAELQLKMGEHTVQLTSSATLVDVASRIPQPAERHSLSQAVRGDLVRIAKVLLRKIIPPEDICDRQYPEAMAAALRRVFDNSESKSSAGLSLKFPGDRCTVRLFKREDFTPLELEVLEEINNSFADQYRDRRLMLLQRLQVSLQTFLWKLVEKGGKKSPAENTDVDLLVATCEPRIATISVESPITLHDLFAASIQLPRLARVSAKTSLVDSIPRVRRIIIAPVPDRGGRTNFKPSLLRQRSSDAPAHTAESKTTDYSRPLGADILEKKQQSRNQKQQQQSKQSNGAAAASNDILADRTPRPEPNVPRQDSKNGRSGSASTPAPNEAMPTLVRTESKQSNRSQNQQHHQSKQQQQRAQSGQSQQGAGSPNAPASAAVTAQTGNQNKSNTTTQPSRAPALPDSLLIPPAGGQIPFPMNPSQDPLAHLVPTKPANSGAAAQASTSGPSNPAVSTSTPASGPASSSNDARSTDNNRGRGGRGGRGGQGGRGNQ